jgi:hypothetical protein
MKVLEKAQSWAALAAHYAPVVILAAAFGWLVGASSLISDDHMVVAVVAPTVAGMSVLGVVTLAGLLAFVGGPAPLRLTKAGPDASERFAVSPDEPSHIHVPRRPKGEGE